MRYLAIDLGTSFVKGAILDLEALTIEHIRREPAPPALPGSPPGYREYDPEAMVGAVRSVMNALLASAPDCRGLVMCSQMHGLVLTDEQGKALSPVLSWLDQRVLAPHPSGKGSHFAVLAARLTADECHELGNELKPGLPITQLFWFVESGCMPQGSVIPASLPDFVLARLSNSAPRWTEASNAMAHGALHAGTLDWHPTALAKLHIDGLAWPQVRRPGEVVTTLKIGGRDLPCYTPVGDFQASLLGALLQEGELSLNISTGSQVSMIAPLQYGNFQNRPFFDRRVRTITHIPAGRSLSALVALLTEIDTARGRAADDAWDYVAQAVAKAQPSALHVDLAFFNSSFGDQGAISNIREEYFTVGYLFRAAFENMAANYHTAALRLSPDAVWRNLVFSGGLAQKFPTLRRIILDRFASPYRICAIEEDTLLGLLALALAWSGTALSISAATARLAGRYISDVHAPDR